MVKKPVAKKEEKPVVKKKSHKELRAEAFNRVVGLVKNSIEGSFRTGRADITLHHGKNIKGKLWESDDDSIPARLNMTFLFKTDENRSEFLRDIDENIKRIDMLKYNKNLQQGLSGLGHLISTARFKDPNSTGKGSTPKDITFHFVVKYKNDNAYKSLPYTNDMLDEVKAKHSSVFQNRSPDTSEEYNIIYKINKQIEKLGNFAEVDLIVQGVGKPYEDIVGVIPGPSGAHADFVGVDKNGKELFFISHKEGNSASAFQQYSGISSKAGDSIHNHEETRKFREIIASKKEQDFDNQSFSQDIVKRNLKVRAVLGPDWQSGGDPGHNNVSHFMQGKVKISSVDSKDKATDKALLRLSFDHKNIQASSISSLIKSTDYEPTLGARRGEDTRSVTFDGNEVRSVRGGIFSSAYIKGRRNNVDLSNPNE